MNEWYKRASAKLAEEKKTAKYDRHAEVMKDAVCEALDGFCKQDEEFAQAVAQGGSFEDCMKAVAKGCGNSLSDLEAYRRAVQFYFPGADVRFQMSVNLCASVELTRSRSRRQRPSARSCPLRIFCKEGGVMYYYKTLEDHEARLLQTRPDFPALDVLECENAANAFFKPYLFFKREEGWTQLWASCCGVAGEMDKPPRTVSYVEAGIIFGKHNDEAVCPFCGRAVTLKETKHLGKRKRLVEYQPVVFLNEKDGDLYARCYWCLKDYKGALNAPPLFKLTYACHFTIGMSEQIYESLSGDLVTQKLEGKLNIKDPVISEPFRDGNEYFSSMVGYHVVGLEAIERSKFRYCQYDRYCEIYEYSLESRGLIWHLMRYLAASSIYPRQIEMLMKTGFSNIVDDFVCGIRKNRGVIDWEKEDYLSTFGLDKQEMRSFRESETDIVTIKWYKQLKKAKLKTDFSTLRTIDKQLAGRVDEFLKLVRKRGIKPEKAMKYLERFTGPRCYGGYFGYQQAFHLWKDYLDMADVLGYDTTHPTVMMPRELQQKHDEAVTAINQKQELERLAENTRLRAEAAKRLEGWHKRYDIELDGYFIRVADSAEEIVAEGKTLQHCVGGYAQRHLLGVTTILFLRRCDCPDTSLYTIEMDGNTLRQIHGFKNDMNTMSPATSMKWLLDPWKDWLKRGSPRDKQGKPKLRIKEAKTA